MAMNLTEQEKREIGQHFVVGFNGYEINEAIKVLVEEYFVGSVILMKRNVKDAHQVRTLIHSLQRLAKDAGHELPLLIGTDQENGLVSAFSSPTACTQFPGALALAATRSLDLTKRVYAASGRELKMLGVNWVYAPVADVNTDMRNPVIGVRSFGDDPLQVTPQVLAAASGLASAGIAPSAKHFPGHGATRVDSHLALPRIMKERRELDEGELVPFAGLFEGMKSERGKLGKLGDDIPNTQAPNLLTVMTGHMALPLITLDDTPCSLSREIATGLLRRDMGFEGVVVTDCLEMDAIADIGAGGCGVEEGAVRALEAGADVVMICHTLERQVGAVRKAQDALGGRLGREEISKGGRRVRELKEAVCGAWEDVLGADEDGVGEVGGEGEGAWEEEWKTLKEDNRVLSEQAYGKSTAVLQEGIGLPLKVGPRKKVLLLTPEQESLNRAVDDADGVLRGKEGNIRNTTGASFLAMAASVAQRVNCSHVVYAKSGEQAVSLEGITGIILVLRNADRAAWQIALMKEVVRSAELGRVPVVLVASCEPYDLVGVTGVEHCGYVACFEHTAEGLEASVKVIFGEKKGEGKSAVKFG